MVTASVAIHQDKKKGILIFPRWKDECGVRRLSLKYILLGGIYTECELGENILQAIKISEKNEQEKVGQNAYQDVAGVKNWNAFQKKYESVEISIIDSVNWKISRLKKKKGHSYGLDKDELDKYTKLFPAPLPAEELGKVVLELFAMK